MERRRTEQNNLNIRTNGRHPLSVFRACMGRNFKREISIKAGGGLSRRSLSRVKATIGKMLEMLEMLKMSKMSMAFFRHLTLDACASPISPRLSELLTTTHQTSLRR